MKTFLTYFLLISVLFNITFSYKPAHATVLMLKTQEEDLSDINEIDNIVKEGDTNSNAQAYTTDSSGTVNSTNSGNTVDIE